ncbi:TPR-like protein [Aureobasidium pullulans]|uniref:Peroxisomal targeting signal receptor n=1 Tax=Aureobasidium pullulans TaxID=5580 RepID=A0A4T0E5V2_AURPU|nr:TPR-like protein [Aureobasidium pullulans]
MSFLGGAECSTAGNPLSQFTKHVQDDKSLQRDRLVGRGPGGMESMRSQMGAPQDAMMEEFMQQPAHLGPSFQDSPFAMEQMRRELDQAASPAPAHWAAEFEPQMSDQAGPAFAHQNNGGFNPQDFARFQQNSAARTASPLNNVQQTPMARYQSPMQYGGMYGNGMGMRMGMGGMGMGGMGVSGMQTPQDQQQQSKGKERMVELDDKDWEAQFAELDTTQEQQNDQLDAEANVAMEAELNAMDRSVDQEHSETLFGDFESVWQGIQAETTQNRDFVTHETFGDANDRFDQWDGFDGLNTHRDPSLGDYMFEDDNPFTELANPYDEGMKIMREGGNLSLAALAFEAAVQKDADHMGAWTALGQAQAQNEKESPAIRALEHALKLDPNNLEALMGLAVSYTNEGYDSTAYRTLERWVATKYPSLINGPLSSQDDEIGFTDRHALHEKVTDLFIQAAQLSPDGEQMDPDVQVGLGVLFYGAEEYDKAVDCFGAALASTEEGSTNRQEELHLLWNRLGATLANSGRSEEAIDAYSRALEMRPNFVRARYNLGVSCINIGCYEEAAQHLLGALAMHRITEKEGLEKAREVVGDTNMTDAKLEAMITQNQSTNLYDTLRRVFAQMERRDLQELVGPGMNLEEMRQHFEF